MVLAVESDFVGGGAGRVHVGKRDGRVGSARNNVCGAASGAGCRYNRYNGVDSGLEVGGNLMEQFGESFIKAERCSSCPTAGV